MMKKINWKSFWMGSVAAFVLIGACLKYQDYLEYKKIHVIYNAKNQSVWIIGHISPHFYDALQDSLQAHKIKQLVITSYGGDMDAMESITTLLHKNHVERVMAYAYCFSACTHIWASATKRETSSSTLFLFHRPRYNNLVEDYSWINQKVSMVFPTQSQKLELEQDFFHYQDVLKKAGANQQFIKKLDALNSTDAVVMTASTLNTYGFVYTITPGWMTQKLQKVNFRD